MNTTIEEYYVTLTWHDFPEGGSCGFLVEASSYQEAEALARAQMVDSYGEDRNEDWHVIDCWPVSSFRPVQEVLKRSQLALQESD